MEIFIPVISGRSGMTLAAVLLAQWWGGGRYKKLSVSPQEHVPKCCGPGSWYPGVICIDRPGPSSNSACTVGDASSHEYSAFSWATWSRSLMLALLLLLLPYLCQTRKTEIHHNVWHVRMTAKQFFSTLWSIKNMALYFCPYPRQLLTISEFFYCRTSRTICNNVINIYPIPQ